MYRFFRILLILIATGVIVWSIYNNLFHRKIGAYLRVKDEINTIEATLNSIDGLFDHIVIIHSNEPDDGSVAFMKKWCRQRIYCEIHEYPYAVIPAYDIRYRNGEASPRNRLSAYYNFGLQFFEPTEWIVKIDADQVYIRSQLKKTIEYIRTESKDSYKYGIMGYNTYLHNGRLVKNASQPINGGWDSFIVQRKDIIGFIQKEYWEQLKSYENIKTIILPEMHWFHYKKILQSNGVVRLNELAEPNADLNLTRKERQIYEREIKGLIPQYSKYYNIQY